MRRLPLRSVIQILVIAMTVGSVGYVHAASLNGISSASLDAWTMPTVINYDTTPPMITASISPAANGAGWHKAAATVTFACTDTESGVASCSTPVTVSTQGAGQVVVGNAVDVMGNTASASASLNIDLTAPTVNIVGVTNGAVLAALPAVTCSASDALSGLAGPCSVGVTAGANGAYTAQASAGDIAGNVTTVTVSFQVSAPPVPSGTCGSGPANVPCVVPLGTVFKGNLKWDADVVVLGEVTGKVDVNNGSITVGSGGIVNKLIQQTGTGGVTLLPGSLVNAKIMESGPGSVTVGGIVNGKIDEKDDGDLIIGPTAVVNGSVKETGNGSLRIDGSVTGNADEEGNGDLIIGPTAVVNGTVSSIDAGICDISASAIVSGARLNKCAI